MSDNQEESTIAVDASTLSGNFATVSEENTAAIGASMLLGNSATVQKQSATANGKTQISGELSFARKQSATANGETQAFGKENIESIVLVIAPNKLYCYDDLHLVELPDGKPGVKID